MGERLTVDHPHELIRRLLRREHELLEVLELRPYTQRVNQKHCPRNGSGDLRFDGTLDRLAFFGRCNELIVGIEPLIRLHVPYDHPSFPHGSR